MFPHERSLVKKLQGKPFALVGVNSDEDREAAKKDLEKEGITWRSFWAGGTGGAIPGEWAVRTWPTIVIIDHKGVIRYKHLGNPGEAVLDREINQLVKEAESQVTS